MEVRRRSRSKSRSVSVYGQLSRTGSVDLIMVPAPAAADEDPQLRVFGSLRAPLITRHATMLPQALIRPLQV